MVTKGVTYGSNPATCLVRALQAWLESAAIEYRPLFRSLRFGRVQPHGLDVHNVTLITKRAATLRGLNPLYRPQAAGKGLATTAATRVSERAIMEQTGHKSLTLLCRYISMGSLFKDSASA